jgi:hypothetical protein
MNGITMWRPDPVFSGELLSDLRSTPCTNRAKSARPNVKANNG